MSETVNPYESNRTPWSDREAKRLKSMDALQAAIARVDLEPVLDRIDQGSIVLDIGAGTGTTVEGLCRDRGITYVALDVNQALLDQRPDGEGIIKIRATSNETGLEGASMDVTYSKAVTAWNRTPQAAIAEQLRVTKPGGRAVFTEFDWSVAGPGEESSLEEAELLEGIRSALRDILGKSGFQPDYGQYLATDVDSVIDATGTSATREETRHLFPEGDHRELLLGAAEGLAHLARMNHLLPEPDLDHLNGNIAAFKELDHASFFIPALITQKVHLHPID